MRGLILAAAALVAVGWLHADLHDYLKPALNKSGQHGIRNVDFIYVINLDQRPEKWAGCLDELEPFGIVPYRFSAVNGWELPLVALATLGVVFDPRTMSSTKGTAYLIENKGQPHHDMSMVPGRCYYCHCMSRGAVGIVLSHLSVLKDAFDSDFDTIWVMEDDIEVLQDPRMISDLIEQLDELVGAGGWDVLFTDRDTKNNQGAYVPCYGYAKRPNFRPKRGYRFARREDIGAQFRSIGARYGAYSMIIRRSGMKKILDYYDRYQIFLPYDLDFFMPDDIKMYTVRRDVVSTKPGSPSDNGGPGYKNKKRNRQRFESPIECK